MGNVIDKPLSEEEKNRGIKRKYIPVGDVIKRLEEIRNDPKLWTPGRYSGADMYQGLPPFLRNIDELIHYLQS